MSDLFTSLRQKLVIVFFLLVDTYFLIETVFFFVQDFVILGILLFTLVFIVIIWTAMIRFRSLTAMMGVSFIFLAIISMYATIFAIFLRNHTTCVGLWLFVIPVGTLVFIDQKVAFTTSILCVITYFLLDFVPINALDIFQFEPHQIKFIYVSTIISCGVIFIYMLFCAWRLKKAQTNDSFNKEKEKEKFEILYKRIIDLFEREKIYTNPNLSMAELADKLDTNKTYIYRALKQHGIDDNFNVLVNKYRIKEFKNKVHKGGYEKYKINYLFESCGFKFQSAFNKIFKDLEGITPSEYILVHKSKQGKR